MSDSALLSQLDAYRDVAAARVGDEPVISACPFSHRGLMSLKAAGHFGMLARFATKKAYKARAGGLPDHFVLAVTPSRVHVFECPIKAFKAGAPKQYGDELAVWDRSQVQVSWTKGGPYMLDVTISTAEDTYNVRVGDAEPSHAFLRLLAGADQAAA